MWNVSATWGRSRGPFAIARAATGVNDGGASTVRVGVTTGVVSGATGGPAVARAPWPPSLDEQAAARPAAVTAAAAASTRRRDAPPGPPAGRGARGLPVSASVTGAA
jgi:hypothetical protein